jgi:integrase/recombinase XerC
VQLELLTRITARPPVLEDRRPSSATTTIRRMVDAFLLAAVDNPNTRRAYRTNLLKAFDTVRVCQLQDLHLPHLAALRAAVTNSPLATSSQAQAISAMRAFLSWTAADSRALSFPIEAARRILRIPTVQTTSKPDIVTREEAGTLLGHAQVATGERAMVTVLLGAGLRVAELCSLDCGDVFEHAPGLWAIRVRGKRGKERIVPVHPPVVAAVREYLEASGRPAAAGALFLAHDSGAASRPRQRLTTGGARRRITALLRRASVTKRVSVHGFRHSYAVAVLEAGHDLNALRRLLGHASLATTQRYLDHGDLDGLLRTVPHDLTSPCPRPAPA